MDKIPLFFFEKMYPPYSAKMYKSVRSDDDDDDL